MKIVKGNIFESSAQVLVNPVNLDGVMGKGLALDFKKKYPQMYVNYKKYCQTKELTIGKLYLYKSLDKWILLFPTKSEFYYPSKVDYIEKGLIKFVNTYKEKIIKSIAFPMLGCGNGGLDFEYDVYPLFEKYLSKLDDIDIYIYVNK